MSSRHKGIIKQLLEKKRIKKVRTAANQKSVHLYVVLIPINQVVILSKYEDK